MSRARELVAFLVGGRRCALDLDVVERVEPMVAVTALPGAPEGVLGAIDVRGTAVPVLDLRARLGLAPAAPDPDAALVLARTSRRLVALPVDEALGVQRVDPDAVMPGETFDLEAAGDVATRPEGLLYIADLEAFLTPEAERRLGPVLAITAQ